MYVTGEFEKRDAIIRALQDLKVYGLDSNDLDVFSDEPLELPRDSLGRRSHMSLAVVTGAIVFCILVISFVYFTQYNYPVVTGGMPVFSFWATGVVFYELTMFGAIVTTLFWFLLESGLLRRGPRMPAPTFKPGSLCLRVHCQPDRKDVVREALQKAGASNFQSVDDPA